MQNNQVPADGSRFVPPEPPPVCIDRETLQRWIEQLKLASLEPNVLQRTILSEMEYSLLVPADPARSGVGQWCAPGPADQQERRYLLRFEDAERGDVSFTEELQARSMFARAEARGWNCHLFAHMPRDPKTAAFSGLGQDNSELPTAP